MSNYRRAYITGGHYFFTVVTYQRIGLFADKDKVARLGEAFRHVKKRHPFSVDAIVVLPDHLHTIWRLPEDDADFSVRWRLIKHYLARGLDCPTNRRGEKLLWQRRFWEHLLRDEEDWRNHVDYIHYNPVRHGYSNSPIEWKYSSFTSAVKRGWYEADWGCNEPAHIQKMQLE